VRGNLLATSKLNGDKNEKNRKYSIPRRDTITSRGAVSLQTLNSSEGESPCYK